MSTYARVMAFCQENQPVGKPGERSQRDGGQDVRDGRPELAFAPGQGQGLLAALATEKFQAAQPR